MIEELNHCAKVATRFIASVPRLTPLQEITQANFSVTQAAELAVKYRKNVLYNLEATGLVKKE
jgi:hypothetical protein